MNLTIRKITVTVLAFALFFAATAVFAGGQASSGQGQVFTVRVWGGVPAENGPQDAINAFNREFRDKGIQAEYTRFVNDPNGNLQLETNLMSGDSVDVYMNYALATFAKRVESNMAVDQGPLIARDNFNVQGFGLSNLEEWIIDGKNYGFPTTNNGAANCLMLNKDMFDAAGIPIPTKWTYSEFREVARRLTRGSGPDKIYGAFFRLGADIGTGLFHSYHLPRDWQYGPGNRSWRINQEPAVKEAIQFAYNVMNVDGSVPTYADTITQKLSEEGMFMGGKAAMIVGAWIVRNVKDLVNYPHDFVTAFAPYPVSDRYPVTFNPGNVGDVMAINPKSKNIDACWEYIKWYSTKGIVDMAPGGRLGLYSGLDQDALTQAFITGGEKVFHLPTLQSAYIMPRDNMLGVRGITYKAAELNQVWKETLEAIYTDRMSIDAALAEGEARGTRILLE